MVGFAAINSKVSGRVTHRHDISLILINGFRQKLAT